MSHRSATIASYAVAVFIIVVGGALVRTAILNWISGPFIVVACTSVVPPLLMRRGSGSKRA